MATVNTLLTSLRTRLNDSGDIIWTAAEKTDAVQTALKGLYPYWWAPQVTSGVAVAGNMQTLPAGVSRLYGIYRKSAASNRSRPLRNWQEGQGTVMLSQSNLTGDILIYCWTAGFNPALVTDPITGLPLEAEEAALLKAEITLIERLLADKTRTAKYFAQQVREGTTENELVAQLDTMHASLDRLQKAAIPLPHRRG